MLGEENCEISGELRLAAHSVGKDSIWLVPCAAESGDIDGVAFESEGAMSLAPCEEESVNVERESGLPD